MSVRIKLTHELIGKAHAIAYSRWEGKEQLSSTRNYHLSNTSESVHQMGARGEIAVAEYYGWDIDAVPRMAGDNGSDFFYHGHRIDVQTTRYYPPHLKYDSKHPFRADIAILVCQISLDQYEITGWITRQEFEKLYTVEDYGYGQRQTAKGLDLHPPSLLRVIRVI